MASTGSAIARPRSTGFQILSDELTLDFFKRQGTTCTAGACPSNAPPPATTTAPPAAPPPESPTASASPPVQSSSPSSTVPDVTPPSPSVIPPSPSPDAVIPPSPTQATPLIQTTTAQPDPLLQTPGSTSSTSSSSSSSSSSQQDPLPQPSSSGSSTPAATTDLVPAPVGNGNVNTTLTDGLVTGTGTGTSAPLLSQTHDPFSPPQNGTDLPSPDSPQNGTALPSPDAPSPNGTGLPTPSSTVSYSVSYQFSTVTDAAGSESISIGTVSISEAVVPVTSDSALAAPLVVQQAAPDAPPTPVCQLQYLPDNVWETSGVSDNTTTTTTTSTNGTTSHPGIVSQCNNGTRVTNKVGAQIHLTFIGTEASLLMVPGVMGGEYDVKLDDEDATTLSNYKPDTTSCQVSAPWSRTGLTNEPHDITITVKGAPAGSVGGGSQVEFNGLTFKGPQTTTASSSSSGPNWVIIGASIGAGVIVIALIIILILCIRRRRRAQSVTPTPLPRPPSAVSSFRPQTVLSGHARTDSNFSGTAQPGHYRADSNFSNTPSGHYRGDSSFSTTPYSPGSPSQVLQQDPFGHSRQQSDVPLMMQQQAQQAPWQIPTGGMANVPSGSPYHSNMSSPQSRPLTFAGYNNGQERPPPGAGYGIEHERQSFVQSHDRATSYGSDGRNPFE